MRMDWDKLRIFHTVAEAGSFTQAGEQLHLSQSAVSRQISGLEGSLQVPLFHRHARGLKLTEQGEELYNTAHEVFSKLVMAEARLSESKVKATGELKVTTTVALGSVWLTPRMKGFISRNPEIDVSLVLADNELDLSMREADVAIRLAPPTQQGLVQRKLMGIRYHIFAAPEYLKKRGIPRVPQDLDDHDLIVYGEEASPPVANLNWLLDAGVKNGVKRKPILKVNSIYGIFRAVQSGLGLGALPDYSTHVVRNLVEVLPELRGPSIDAFFVYPEELRNSKRIAVFRDYLLSTLDDRRS